jgi:hypothetical protein
MPSATRQPPLQCLALALWAVAAGASALPAQQPLKFDNGISIGSPIPAPSAAPGVQNPSARPTGESYYARPGPWGRLRCVPVFLEAPLSIVEGFQMPNPKPRWSVRATRLDNFGRLLREAGLPAASIARLTDPGNTAQEGDSIHLFPSEEDIAGLGPAGRAKVYKELATHEANAYHVRPVLIAGKDVRAWFAGSALPQPLIELVEKYSYPLGNATAFSDVPLLLSRVDSHADALRVLKACSRTRTLLVKMEVDRSTDLRALLEYYTTGLNLRRKDIEPMLAAMVEANGADRLDIVHLLPALPRKLLYTYPAPEMAREGTLPDCHWTSLNFYNYYAEEAFLDTKIAASAILENFKKVDPPYRFSDLLVYHTPDDRAIHSAIYIADDIVYTKNGRNPARPWVLSTLSELEEFYLREPGLRLQGWRKHSKE